MNEPPENRCVAPPISSSSRTRPRTPASMPARASYAPTTPSLLARKQGRVRRDGRHRCRAPAPKQGVGDEREPRANALRHPLFRFDPTLDPRRRRCFGRSGGEVSSGLDGRRLALRAAVGWVVASRVRAAGWLCSGRRACRVAPG